MAQGTTFTLACKFCGLSQADHARHIGHEFQPGGGLIVESALFGSASPAPPRKETIAASYMDSTKALHAAKRYAAAPDRRALVIGAHPHTNIGAAIVRRLLADGFGSVLAPTEQECDVARQAIVSGYFRDIATPDTLVLCNGETHLDWFEDAPTAKVLDVYNNTLIGSTLAAQEFVRCTLSSPVRKSIVFIGSMAYRNVLNASAVYCAAKAGLAQLMRCLAWELAPKGYDVFAVHPSNTEGTPMTEATIRGIMRYRDVDRATAEGYWGAVLPRAEWLQPDDIAHVVSGLVSGRQSYLAGCNVELAGGQR